MLIQLSNPARMADLAMAEALEPPPPVDYLAWAPENVVFTDRETQYPGPYNREVFPEFDEPLRALSPDDPCRIVTISKSAQIGGTVLANIFTLGSMDLAPGDFLVTHPTDDNARRWSKMKLSPMLKATTALTGLFPQNSRDGSDSVLYKERVDGRGAIQISGANSPASLSQVSMRRQVQDDLSKWDMNSAGDPETQADSRSRAFAFAKILKISTPLVNPGCRITRNFKDGSQEKLHLPCPHCDHLQVLEWGNMLATIEADAEDPHFTCIECGCEIREHQLPAMKTRLQWIAENPKAKPFHRSFWIWSAYSVLQSWIQIAREWLTAKGDAAKERVFFNDTLGLAYEAAGEAPAWELLRDRAQESTYSRGEIPAGALIITIGIDCQGDRVEYQVVGWGRESRRWTIEYDVIRGHISDPACQANLNDLVRKTWRNVAGRPIAADKIAIDGNAYTEEVWGWARKHSKVIMVRGVGADTAPLLAKVKKERSKSGKVLKYQSKFFNFGTSVLKMALYRHLTKTDPLERGYVGLPKGLEDEFYRQLTAERRKAVVNKKGFTVHQWVKDPSQANEGLDTHLQAEAAAIHYGVRGKSEASWDHLEQERESPPQGQQLDLEDLPLMTAPRRPASSPSPASAEANPVRRPGTPVPPAAPPGSPPPDEPPRPSSSPPSARRLASRLA